MALTPYWPLLMDEGTVCRFLCLGIRQFRQLLNEGYLPPARHLGLGINRWNREELESVVAERLASKTPLRADERMRAEVARALATFKPRPPKAKKKPIA